MAAATTSTGKWAEDLGFANAVNQMQTAQLKSDSMKDVKNLGILSLGVGAAGAGAIGLYNVLKRNKERKTHGPAVLPMSLPTKGASFLAGDDAATKSGIPWYGPAMLMGGLAGLGLGWKGTDYLLNRRRKSEGQAELDKARQEFNDALLAQNAAPKTASERSSTMEKVGRDLDRLFDMLQAPLQKEALDLANAGGQALGGYGMYAGLSGLLTGAVLYNQAKKRSRQAVLEAAMKRRHRRNFMQSPTSIEAVPDDAGATLDVTGGS
jgi:hypothetical protein